jgi:type I restriction enzyme S subunit
VEITGGGTPSRDRQDYWGGDIPWASVKDLVGPELNTTKETISPEGLANSASRLIAPGEVVIATRMGLGKAAINTVPIAINQDLKALRCRPNLAPRFLLHFLLSKASVLEAMGKGATVKGIKIDQLVRLAVPLPSLAEQRRIAAILDKADAIRRKRQQAIQLTDDLLRSAFLEIAGPGNRHYSRWPIRSIEQLAAKHDGAIRTGPFGSDLRHSEFVESGIAVLGIDNAVNNRFEWGELRFITAEKFRVLERYRVYPGDVIVTIMGTTGRSAVVPDDIPAAISTKHLATITPDLSLVQPQFLSNAIHRHPAILRQIHGADRGAIMPGLNLTLLKALKVPLPPPEQQATFSSIVASTRTLQSKLETDLGATSDLFAALVQRAFQGEL